MQFSGHEFSATRQFDSLFPVKVKNQDLGEARQVAGLVPFCGL
jgi:hypothetical protein